MSVQFYLYGLLVLSTETSTDMIQPQLLSVKMPSEWERFCPYTDFCGRKASKTLSLNNQQKLCCVDCSCDPNCGIHRNCCQYEMDAYKLNYKYEANCMVLTTSTEINSAETTYWVVDKCPDEYNCADYVEAAKWGGMYPVYSPVTSNIYLNKPCAACHNDDENVAEWQIEFHCNIIQDGLNTIKQGLLNALHGDNTACSFTFFPPKGLNLEQHVCYRNKISKCEVEIPQQDALWNYPRLCESFNASFFHRSFVFANVFCYVCSRFYLYNETNQPVCKKSISQKTQNVPFSFLISANAIKHLITPRLERNRTTNYCRKDELQEKKTGSCRKYLCPEGQFLIEGKCSFLTDEWRAGPFRTYIKLNPVGNKKIPLTALEELSNARGNVFKKLMPKWTHALYYNYKTNSSFLDHFVLELQRGVVVLNPTRLINDYKNSFNRILYLTLNGTIYKLQTSAYKHHSLVWCYFMYNSSSDRVLKGSSKRKYRVPVNSSCSKKHTGNNIYLVQDTKSKSLGRPSIASIALTKLYLCKLVSLYSNEYVKVNSNMLYLNTSGLYLGQSEFRTTRDIYGVETVSVCYFDLGNDFWTNNATAFRPPSCVVMFTINLVLMSPNYFGEN